MGVSRDEIAGAILEMFNTLLLVDGMDGRVGVDGVVYTVPFSDNVSRAVERFDRPELRQELARLLYRNDSDD